MPTVTLGRPGSHEPRPDHPIRPPRCSTCGRCSRYRRWTEPEDAFVDSLLDRVAPTEIAARLTARFGIERKPRSSCYSQPTDGRRRLSPCAPTSIAGNEQHYGARFPLTMQVH